MTDQRFAILMLLVIQAQAKCRQHSDPRVRNDGFYEDGAFYSRSTGKFICREK